MNNKIKLWNILYCASIILDINTIKIFIKYILISMKCKECYIHGMNFIENSNISDPTRLIYLYHKDVDKITDSYNEFINNIKSKNLYIEDCFELILSSISFDYNDYFNLLSIINNICLDKIEDILGNDYHILTKIEIYLNIFKQYRLDVFDNTTLIEHFLESKSTRDLCYI